MDESVADILYNEMDSYINIDNADESFYPSNLEGINTLAKEFLDEYHEIFYSNHIHDENYSSENVIESKITEIENLELRVENSELDNEWRAVIFASTNVGKYSLRYWNENLEAWTNNPNSPLFQAKCGIGGCYTDDVVDIAGADVAGAATGATTALIVNVIPGPGQMAYGTAIISMGVGASVGSAVKKIWDWAWS